MEFPKGEINGYVVRAEKLTKALEEIYDWRIDILSEDFDPAYVKQLLKAKADKPLMIY